MSGGWRYTGKLGDRLVMHVISTNYYIQRRSSRADVDIIEYPFVDIPDSRNVDTLDSGAM